MTEDWKLTVEVPQDAVPAIEAALESLDPDNPPTVASFEVDEKFRLWRCEAYFAGKPDQASVRTALLAAAKQSKFDLPELNFSKIEDRDWVAESQKQLQPIRAARYYVHGSHARDAIPKGLIALEIDAGRAFGTGSHETTRGCLLALDRLARRFTPANVLDVGCGSAILALAAWRTWRCPVTATDIDPVAIEVARDNAKLNDIPLSPPMPGPDTLRLGVGAGLDLPLVRENEPFDLVLANILMKPLCALAPAISGALSQRGRMVLSGLLNHQAPAVLNAYRLRGLKLEQRFVLGQWTTLLMRR